MRRRSPSSRQGPPPARARLKLPNALPDVLWTSMLPLKESADAFPPLKSAVSGAIALYQIIEQVLSCYELSFFSWSPPKKRTRHSKADALDIALRVTKIMDVVADAVPDGSDISPSMTHSIDRFSVLLDEIRCAMEDLCRANKISRFMHLNRNERQLQEFKSKLDNVYRDFLAASTLRLEVQQTKLAIQQKQFMIQQTQLHLELQSVSSKTAREPGDKPAILVYYIN
ncbi:hypothetical protein DFH08DRAFT_810403 [Mycena albidolilacea]|uniref:Uncharacterized protein n=1 Tax=Mycena albidolilacea TaxID=1033008 RepID=A0AAD6ZZ54_9AGAR|nr:hypothetical protein DFH08DRAFT_810403 [Mycena albidolilacea]